MIEGLIAKGYAYPGPPKAGPSPATSTTASRRRRTTASSPSAAWTRCSPGARIEPLEGKENPMDFTLWKAAKPGEPAWDSPWGAGRPGWHIECSAMSLRHLGAQIDIHGGGLDLVFPHHENEIAQTEAFTGKVPFASFWMHNGFVQMGDEKMSKSLGNFITMREAIDAYGRDGVRVFVLSSGYRSPLTYSEEAMAAGKTGAERLRTAARGRRRRHRRRPGCLRLSASASSPRWRTTSTHRRPSRCCSTWRARSTAAVTPATPSPRRRGRCESWPACWVCASKRRAGQLDGRRAVHRPADRAAQGAA